MESTLLTSLKISNMFCSHTVPHDAFFDLGINYNWLIEPFGILMDIKGVLNDKPHNRTYWRM